MVIVIATRGDLRDESVMAEEVFALSPISARAVQPSDSDYDAIREAFMETSRGRWFLGEYAKRNRNADTRMVLDAVARIEETLAAHRAPPSPDDRLVEALAAIRGAVDQANEAAASAFDNAALEASLAPIRIGIRIIKEISWRWREIGADGRICDLIDSQLDAIEAGCAKIAERNPHAALIAAFNEIKASIDAFSDMESIDTAPPAEDAIETASSPASDVVAQPRATDEGAVGSDIAGAEPNQAPTPGARATANVEAAIAEAQLALAQAALAEAALAEAVFAQEALAQEAQAQEVQAQEVQAQEAQAREALARDEASAREALREEVLAQEALAQESLSEQAAVAGVPLEPEVDELAISESLVSEPEVSEAPVQASAIEARASEAPAEDAFLDEIVVEVIGTTANPADATVETVAERDTAELEAVELAAEAAEADSDAPADIQSDAHDEAVLQLVAAEMSAPDRNDDFDDYAGPVDDDIIVTMRPAEPASFERTPEPVATAAPVRPPIVQPFAQSAPPVSFQPSPVVARALPAEPAMEPSLGSTIIAHGLLQPAKVPANDPLAPIRRMSQAEKIAFFS
jgi:hypothetical protein